jgi:hypothetical protein
MFVPLAADTLATKHRNIGALCNPDMTSLQPLWGGGGVAIAPFQVSRAMHQAAICAKQRVFLARQSCVRRSMQELAQVFLG